MQFVIEDIIAEGDKVILRWSGSWVTGSGAKGTAEGIDIKRVINGKIVEQWGEAREDDWKK